MLCLCLPDSQGVDYHFLFFSSHAVTAELSKSGNVSVSIGDTLNLTCRAYDCEIDSFVFEWYLNGEELPMSVVIVPELALSHITVEIMSESDLGNYTCNLVNHDSSASVMVYTLGMFLPYNMYFLTYPCILCILMYVLYGHMYMLPEILGVLKHNVLFLLPYYHLFYVFPSWTLLCI